MAEATVGSAARRPRVGLIAHESAREELLALLAESFGIARQCALVTAPEVGLLCEQRLELRVWLVSPGLQRCAEAMAAMAASGALDAVVYLPNPLANPRWDDALRDLVRACNARDVPLATNTATARAVLAQTGALLEVGREGQAASESSRREGVHERERNGGLEAVAGAASRPAGPEGEGSAAHAEGQDPRNADAGLFLLRGELGLD